MSGPEPRRRIDGSLVRGVGLDAEARCVHYDTDRDVVALGFACCDGYFACYRCHEALTDHEAVPWPRERFDEPSVLCGVCGATMTAPAYLGAAHACPACDAPFNPGCRAHAHLYFEVELDREDEDGVEP